MSASTCPFLGEEKAKDMEGISRSQIRTMRFAYLSTVFMIVQFFALSGSVMNLYGIKMGLSDTLIGVLNSPVHLFVLVRLFFAPAVDRWGKKIFLIPSGIISSLLICLLFLVPRLNPGEGSRAGAYLIGVLCLIFLIRHAGLTGWFPLLQDIAPRAYIGRFFARMRMSWQTSSVIFLVAVAVYFGAAPTYAQFNVVFAVAILGGLVQIVFLLLIPEKPGAAHRQDEKAKPGLLAPLRKVAFRRILLVTFLSSLAMGIATPFFVVFMKRSLGQGDDVVLVAACLSGVGFLATVLGWGVLCDRHGTRAIFPLSLGGLALVFFLWLAVFPGTRSAQFLPYLLYLSFGVCTAGMGIAHTRYVFGVVPQRGAARHFSLWNVSMSLAAGTGAILAGFLARAFVKAGADPVAPFWNPYKLLFVLCVATTVAAALVATRLPRPREKGPGEILSLFMTTGRLRILGAIRRKAPAGKNEL